MRELYPVHTRSKREVSLRLRSRLNILIAAVCALMFLSILSGSLQAAEEGTKPTLSASIAQPDNSSSSGSSRASPAVSPKVANVSITPTADSDKVEPISANPGAVSSITGSGLLGRTLGLDEVPGISLGGLWIGNGNYLVTGGLKPESWSFNSLLLVDLVLDLDRLVHIPGAKIAAEALQFNGQPSNSQAGSLMAYQGLVDPKPLNRTELYELWWRQSLFHDKLVIRVGKMSATSTFNNVSIPVPVADKTLSIPAVTGLLYTPIFKNPTLIGEMPGYYNSAYGIVLTYAPFHDYYISYGLYDGSQATHVQTGLQESPTFNGHYFNIAEAGHAWLLGNEHKPGLIAMGAWLQTGELHAAANKEHGNQGFYTYGSQRLWFAHPGIDSSGISGFFQFGINDSNTMLANEYAGTGLTAFGMVPGRADDSFGIGVAWGWLNRDLGLRSNEFMLQTYYQMHLLGATFAEPALSYIPNPGDRPGIPGALALTTQLTVLF